MNLEEISVGITVVLAIATVVAIVGGLAYALFHFEDQ